MQDFNIRNIYRDMKINNILIKQQIMSLKEINININKYFIDAQTSLLIIKP